MVQLSFTGCVNFSDMADVDETVLVYDWGVHEIAEKVVEMKVGEYLIQ